MNITERIKNLVEAADEMLAKARLSTKLSDAESFTQLSITLHAEAQRLADETKVDSVWLFLGFAMKGIYPMKYPDYLEFCARNGWNAVSETDWSAAMAYAQAQSAFEMGQY